MRCFAEATDTAKQFDSLNLYSPDPTAVKPSLDICGKRDKLSPIEILKSLNRLRGKIMR